MTTKNLTIAALALALLVVACSTGQSAETTTSQQGVEGAAGTSLRPSSQGPPPRQVDQVECEDAPEEVAIVCEAYDLIQLHYVDEIEDEDLAAAAVTGLRSLDGASSNDLLHCALPSDFFVVSCPVAGSQAEDDVEAAEAIVAGLANHALDANSVYFDEEALALLQEEQEGEIEGIGALVSPEDETIEGDNKQCNVVSATCRILIVSTIDGAPADVAGLQRDDVIVGVDGESIDGWTVDEVTSRVRGPAGSEVLLTIERAGETLEVSIERAAVVIPVIESDQFGEVGYVQLRLFTDNADEQFQETVLGLLTEGIDTLVVDLRDNPGGLLDTAVKVTSVFLPDGDVVITESPEESRPYPVTGAAVVPVEVEVIFLVNKGSASASEVVSAVLQERGVVTVVGENTFGKNTVQQRFDLSNGGALKLTIARWLTPDGLDFGGVGVTPDIEMSLAEDLETEALVEAVLAAA